MAQVIDRDEEIERRLRHEFSYLFDIDEDRIELTTRIVDMPDYNILDWQAMASIAVDGFGVTLSDEDFYSVQTFGDVLGYITRHGNVGPRR
jgi:hypothetical protein